MRYKPTEKFKELWIENDYQGLPTEAFIALHRGESVELNKVPPRLIDGGFIEKVKKSEVKNGD